MCDLIRSVNLFTLHATRLHLAGEIFADDIAKLHDNNAKFLMIDSFYSPVMFSNYEQ
jgi:hypothetical protein